MRSSSTCNLINLSIVTQLPIRVNFQVSSKARASSQTTKNFVENSTRKRATGRYCTFNTCPWQGKLQSTELLFPQYYVITSGIIFYTNVVGIGNFEWLCCVKQKHFCRKCENLCYWSLGGVNEDIPSLTHKSQRGDVTHLE